MTKRIMVQCATQINRESIRRDTIEGVEHIIVSSYTLPDNVVMNGGLYPAEEIEKSFHTLERTLAPVEHPVDSKGNFLPATDPQAINGFYAGAYNMNVTRENGRVHIKKHINVQEALKSEKGKRLLDRINELETNENPRPIHTSVGLFLEVEPHDEPKINASGIEYTWTGRNFLFDHDAILLDNVGAATPADGVGMAVNAEGEEIEVQQVTFEAAVGDRKRTPADSRTNAEGDSFQQIMEDLQQAIQGIVTADWLWLVDVFDDEAIFETPQGFFLVPYTKTETGVELAGIPIRVDKQVTYIPKVNITDGGTAMKEFILNALKEAGIDTEGLTDDQLFAKYNEHMAANQATAIAEAVAEATKTDDGSEVGKAIANALKPLGEKLDGVIAQINAEGNAEIDKLAEIVGNSDKHPGIDVEAAKKVPFETLKAMAASCADAHGMDLGDFQTNDGKGEFEAPAEMPK